jgi:hypothetical protein
MVCRLSHLLNPRRNGFALIPALAAVAVLAAPAASASAAATPLTGETLMGTATTTNGSASAFRNCIQRYVIGASATFNASGNATGPYPGSFVDEQGSVSLFDTGIHNQLSQSALSVPFTITSVTTTGTTTITGTISNYQSSRFPNLGPLGGLGFLCHGPTVVGLSVNATVTYTATIQVPGQAPQAISGQAHVSGSVSTQSGAQTSLTDSF